MTLKGYLMSPQLFLSVLGNLTLGRCKIVGWQIIIV